MRNAADRTSCQLHLPFHWFNFTRLIQDKTKRNYGCNNRIVMWRRRFEDAADNICLRQEPNGLQGRTDMSAFRNAILLASAAWIVPFSSAQAQDKVASPGEMEADIIVTAQRKDTSLSRTPVTVAVLSADRLADAQIVSEADLRVSVPGLSVRAGTNSNQLNYSIRGNSQDAFSGTRPGVLPYINEVQIGGSGDRRHFMTWNRFRCSKARRARFSAEARRAERSCSARPSRPMRSRDMAVRWWGTMGR
ncbi:TonB-dependent receptor plug domain-containing protein [Sphingobium sp. 15-1]|uniref:TonB-dependent receptor plug domain-containing protein n=1 Tax=Sphingobium sp. 15-1 TaxID=2729616 RepID=UPI002101580E|nr:Plug domain-containing protein [Sphingobium sp. 15-1]